MDSAYLKASKKISLISTFWHSPEYFERAGWKEEENNGVLTIKDSEGVLMFPAINQDLMNRHPIGEGFVWAAVEDPLFGYKKEFLDFNYIYNPLSFDYISGKNWRLWRKNLNKFKSETVGANLEYRFIKAGFPEQIESLFIKWLENQDDDAVIHDDEVMSQWILNPKLDNVKGLFLDGALIGINIWDYGYEFINYRYSLADPDIPFCNYEIRKLFYKDNYIRSFHMLVNDGGDLGKTELAFFKDHLNPIMKLKINSWRKE